MTLKSNQSCRELFFNLANALNNTEVLSAAIVLYGKQTSCIWVFRMNIHNKVFEVLDFLFSLVMIRKQFFYEFLFTFFQGNIVGVSAKNVLKQTFQLVNVIVFLSTEIKCVDFSVLGLIFLFLFDFFLVTLFQVINNCVVMISMLLPELA